MDFTIPVKLHNRFDVVKVDRVTGEETPIAYAENIILNQFWSTYLGTQFFNNIHVGSGTGTLSAARTSLFTHVTTKSVDASAAGKDVANGYAYYRRRITLTETENVGTTFREVGIANSSTTTQLLTHALLKDMNGNPTSILKTNLDILRIYATVYLIISPTTPHSGKLRMEWNLTSDFTALDTSLIILLGGLAYGPYLTGIVFHEMPGPVYGANSSYLIDGYDAAAGSLSGGWDRPNKRLLQSFRLAAATGNAAPEGFYGITMLFSTSGSFSYTVCGYDCHDAADLFAGSVLTGESLGTGDGVLTDFKTAHGKIHDGYVVKVDGVAATGYTVEQKKPKTTSLRPYIRMVKLIPGKKSAAYLSAFHMTFGNSSGGLTRYTQGESLILEHILYDTCDFISFQAYGNLSVYASDDMNTWTLVTSHATQDTTLRTYSIGADYRRKRYFKLAYTTDATAYNRVPVVNPLTNVSDFNNVHFATPPGLVTAEAVGTGDGSDTTFTLAHVPIAGSLTVKLDGAATTDYTLVDAGITFNTAPGVGVAITADYRYSCAITADYTTDAMVKDVNHVLDVTLTLQFGEYTP